MILKSLRDRLPSRGDIFLVFLFCTVPVHSWSIYHFLKEVPAYTLRMTLGEVISIFAYTQAFAFLESLVLLGLLLIIALILPKGYFSDKYIPQCTLFIILLFSWLTLSNSLVQVNAQLILTMGGPLSIILLSTLMHRIQKFEILLRTFAEKLTVLSVFFVALGIMSIVIITCRNLF